MGSPTQFVAGHSWITIFLEAFNGDLLLDVSDNGTWHSHDAIFSLPHGWVNPLGGVADAHQKDRIEVRL
jgi:hypothetical protein